MSFSRFSALLAAALIAVPACAAPDPDPGSGLWQVGTSASVADQYIVRLAPGVAPHGRAAALAHAHGASVLHVYQLAINGFAFHGSPQAAAAIARQSDVLSVTPDQIAVIDGKPVKPPPTPPAEIVPWGITRVGGPIDGTGKVAWVIDTGVDPTSGDLVIDDERSHNFVAYRGKVPAIPWRDGNGHGTHVAGTIAAIDNEREVVGVAAGATVVALRVLGDDGSGSYANIIAALEYMIANGAPGDAANLSLSGPGDANLDAAILSAAAAGFRLALAAGNQNISAATRSPARVEHPNVYTVSAIDRYDFYAYFSNWGNPPIDYAAPGVSVESLKVGGGVIAMDGTSMAAPHVAGLLLLGALQSDGTADSDPDGNPDPIAYRP